MADPSTSTNSPSTEQKTETLQSELSPSSPQPAALVHLDSELTITSTDKKEADEYYADKQEVDIEYASATVDPQDKPVLVDGPLYGWIVVFASFSSQMISMGVCNVFGVYQVRERANHNELMSIDPLPLPPFLLTSFDFPPSPWGYSKQQAVGMQLICSCRG